MDIRGALKVKRAQIAKLQNELAILEKAALVLNVRGEKSGDSRAKGKRRGRGKFTQEQKEAQAARMRAYWEAKKSGTAQKAQ